MNEWIENSSFFNQANIQESKIHLLPRPCPSSSNVFFLHPESIFTEQAWYLLSSSRVHLHPMSMSKVFIFHRVHFNQFPVPYPASTYLQESPAPNPLNRESQTQARGRCTENNRTLRKNLNLTLSMPQISPTKCIRENLYLYVYPNL